MHLKLGMSAVEDDAWRPLPGFAGSDYVPPSGELLLPEDPAATVAAPSFVVRPSGHPHGPFRSEAGCVMLQIHYDA